MPPSRQRGRATPSPRRRSRSTSKRRAAADGADAPGASAASRDVIFHDVHVGYEETTAGGWAHHGMRIRRAHLDHAGAGAAASGVGVGDAASGVGARSVVKGAGVGAAAARGVDDTGAAAPGISDNASGFGTLAVVLLAFQNRAQILELATDIARTVGALATGDWGEPPLWGM
jgi:hypothetical protein